MSDRFDRQWIDRWVETANADPTLGVIGKHFTARFLLEVGELAYVVSMRAGRIEFVATTEELGFESAWQFAIRGPRESWERFVLPKPPPRYTDVVFMGFHGHVALEGDLLVFWQHVRALLWMLDLMREVDRERLAA